MAPDYLPPTLSLSGNPPDGTCRDTQNHTFHGMRRLHGRARARGPDSRARGAIPHTWSKTALRAYAGCSPQTGGAQSERPLGHRRNASWPAHALFGDGSNFHNGMSGERLVPRAPRRGRGAGGCAGAQLARPQHRILSTQVLQYTLLQDAARKRRKLQPFHAPRMVPHCGPLRQALTKRAREPPQRRPTKGGGEQGGEREAQAGAITACIPKHIHGAKSGQASG